MTVSSYIDKPNSNFTSPLSEQKYKQIISEVKESLSKKINKEKLTALDYRRLNRFEILSIGGMENIIQKRKDESDVIKYYVTVSELYNILEKAHQDTGHKRILGMEKEVNKRYCNISRRIIEEYLQLCLQCQLKKKLKKKGLVTKPLLSDKFNKRGQVDLIDMQSEKHGEFKFILNYQDHLTKFVFLRPLKTKRAEEVAYNLMDIFCIIGAPCLLHSDNGREFVNAVVTNLADMFEAKIIHGKPRHSESQGSVERANQDIRDILVAWMNENNSTKWSEGLRFVQMKKNRSYHRGIERTPYEALFGMSMINGFKDSDLPLQIVEKLQDEEDIDKLLSANESMENTVANPEESFDVERENYATGEVITATQDGMKIQEVPTEQDAMEVQEVQTEQDGVEVQEVPTEQDGVEVQEVPTEQDGVEVQEVPTEQDGVEVQEVQTEQDGVEVQEVPTEQDGVEVQEVPTEQDGMEDQEDATEQDKTGDGNGEAQNVIKLNVRSALIEKNRDASSHRLKRQAGTMLRYSSKKFPLVTVGQNVVIKIPDEDRGRAAPRNIMAMVISEENGFYKLGTPNGVLEKMYTRKEFQLSQSEFITSEDIPSTSSSMRQIAAKETRFKQGFKYKM